MEKCSPPYHRLDCSGESPGGVWAVGSYDMRWDLSKVFADELEAYRAAESYQDVIWLPFGVELQQARNDAK